LRCFEHNDRHAVGVCSNCGKAVCQQCYRNKSKKIACSETCIHELFLAEQLDIRLRQSLGVGIQPPLPASVSSYFLFGLILLVTGAYMSLQRGRFEMLTFAVAAVFFVMSGVSYRQYKNRCLSC